MLYSWMRGFDPFKIQSMSDDYVKLIDFSHHRISFWVTMQHCFNILIFCIFSVRLFTNGRITDSCTGEETYHWWCSSHRRNHSRLVLQCKMIPTLWCVRTDSWIYNKVLSYMEGECLWINMCLKVDSSGSKFNMIAAKTKKMCAYAWSY